MDSSFKIKNGFLNAIYNSCVLWFETVKANFTSMQVGVDKRGSQREPGINSEFAPYS